MKMTSKGPGLYEFLIEAELQQYFAGFKNDLKVQNVAQLKYVSDEDLQQLGMSKPEMRRLKKYFQKHFPQNYLSKFKKMILSRKEEQWECSLPDEPPDKPPIRVPNKHIIPADAIIVNKELGTGEFGVVQQGVWTNDGERIQVAIKCLSRERMQNNPIEFLKEAAIMHAIDHEHIVRLYGVVLDTNALMLVTELAALRSLLECLKEPSLRASFPVLSLCHFAIQICDGMQYLEAKRLIHRDLAARNILVFSKNKVKISDFGLSRALGVGKDYYQTNFNVNLKLPIAWCAPECITYLKFTSASDVWAYAVTLWEMFSYGFQPWAALTGQQILEAIDEPNPQRLERPECCPKEYYSLMRKCWHHDPSRRPKFNDLMRQLPDCKPEQVQAIQDSGDERMKRDQLIFRVGDIITVLDKSPVQGTNLWKGVLNNGKTGVFNPALTVAYLGSNLPSNKPTEFIRGDGKNAYSSKRNRLRTDMISAPHGDVKHTGHVGLDGAYFGDISFLGGTKYEHVPHQVVAPYKPHTDNEDTNSISTDKAPLLGNITHTNGWADTTSNSKLLTTDHEYHEITDEEAVDSPGFEKQFDFGPSLLDEMDAAFRNYSSPPPPPPPPSSSSTCHSMVNEIVGNGSGTQHSNQHEQQNKRNESLSATSKKLATVKPISSSDEKTLDTAIALTYELANKVMVQQVQQGPETSPNGRSNGSAGGGVNGGSGPHKSGSGSGGLTFKFPQVGGSGGGGNAGGNQSRGSHSRHEGRTFTDEAQAIPDVHGSLTSEAKAVYSMLVEQPVEANPLRMLRSAPLVRPKIRGNKHQRLGGVTGSMNTLSLDRKLSIGDPPNVSEIDHEEDSSHNAIIGDNAIPLPPRDRTRSLLVGKPRHERKYPLIIPTAIAQALSQHSVSIAKNNEPTYLGLEDDPPEEAPVKPENSSTFNNIKVETPQRTLDGTNQVGFEERIANSFDLLDQMEDCSSSEAEEISKIPAIYSASTGNGDNGTGNVVSNVEEQKDEDQRLMSVMTDVLGAKVSQQVCEESLKATNNDVHRAIKLARLRALVVSRAEANGEESWDIQTGLATLRANYWDVGKAALEIFGPRN
ncbi:activated Cdc42 kinase-like isoform X2 [Rhodnius prolixus]|uniref:activated Cdc42 kinase-like isoform X2 n=1 Tax=Rhodnius prolixus TaxID=13249 RepID=UPI003D189C4A